MRRRFPVHEQAVEAERARWVKSALELAMHEGDDYELLFTVSAEAKVLRRLMCVGLGGSCARNHAGRG